MVWARHAQLCTAAALAACVARAPADGSNGDATTFVDGTAGTATTTTTSIDDTTASGMPPATAESTTLLNESSDADSDWSGGCVPFLCEPDNGPEPCDLWAQDCPRGEKCMPRAAEGSFEWSETVCSPIADDPAGPGDPCVAEGSGVSGIDDCEAGAMCWNVDPENNVGTCVSLCLGNQPNPTCADPHTECRIFNDGFLILCLPPCDPIAQDCAVEQVCIADGDAFVCSPSYQTKAGPGDPCQLVNDCDPGSFCAEASTVPACATARCCSSFCDLLAPDPDAPCTLPGQVCTPWFELGMVPPGLAHVGACALP